MQAALTGGTLRLERALDEKEREVQLQRVEIYGLKEHLRAVEAAARRAAPTSGDGGKEGAPGYTTSLDFGSRLENHAKYLVLDQETESKAELFCATVCA